MSIARIAPLSTKLHDGISRTTGRTSHVTYALSGIWERGNPHSTPARAMADVLGSPIFDSSNRGLSWHSLQLGELRKQHLQASGVTGCLAPGSDPDPRTVRKNTYSYSGK